MCPSLLSPFSQLISIFLSMTSRSWGPFYLYPSFQPAIIPLPSPIPHTFFPSPLLLLHHLYFCVYDESILRVHYIISLISTSHPPHPHPHLLHFLPLPSPSPISPSFVSRMSPSRGSIIWFPSFQPVILSIPLPLPHLLHFLLIPLNPMSSFYQSYLSATWRYVIHHLSIIFGRLAQDIPSSYPIISISKLILRVNCLIYPHDQHSQRPWRATTYNIIKERTDSRIDFNVRK